MERLDAPPERGFGWDGVETSSWSALRRNGSPSPIWPRMTEERCAPLETQVASRGTDGSNPTSSSGESGELSVPGCGGSTGRRRHRYGLACRGTRSSNPSPSSGESDEMPYHDRALFPRPGRSGGNLRGELYRWQRRQPLDRARYDRRRLSGGTYRQVFYVADVGAAGPPVNGEVHVDLDEADFLAVFVAAEPAAVRVFGDQPICRDSRIHADA